MNEEHAELCSSAEWAEHLQTEVIAPLVDGVGLGPRLIEIGPGPGAATAWLRQHAEHLTAVEAEVEAAKKLAERFPDVDVVHADATSLPYEDGTFDAAATFTMLHHVPTRDAQDRLLAELVRVVRPGGVIVGSDSLASDKLREFHHDDTYNPIPPGYLLEKLRELGCAKVTITVTWGMTFVAYTSDA
jgi:ubiquinone/menaquinone biosynthesis C-methylase UbiE